MSNLTASYFDKEPLRIAGIDTTSFDGYAETAIELQNEIESYIELYEPIFLTDMLGKEYATILDADSALKSKIFAKDGAGSPCAKFVYFKYKCDKFSENTMSGDKVISASNSSVMPNISKLANIWNIMSKEIKEILLDSDNADLVPNFESSIFHDCSTCGI